MFEDLFLRVRGRGLVLKLSATAACVFARSAVDKQRTHYPRAQDGVPRNPEEWDEVQWSGHDSGVHPHSRAGPERHQQKVPRGTATTQPPRGKTPREEFGQGDGALGTFSTDHVAPGKCFRSSQISRRCFG